MGCCISIKVVRRRDKYMNDRFLDDTNIKKSVQAINPQLQAALERTKQLKEGISQQINALSSEDRQKLIQPVQIDKKQIVDNIQESLDLPKPVTKSKRNRKVAQKIEEPNKINILDNYNDDDQISRNLAVDNIDNLAVNQLITDTIRQSSSQLSQSVIVKDNDKEPDIIPLDRPDRIIREEENNDQINLSQEQIYQNEVQKILQQHPELKPEQNAGININMTTRTPNMSNNMIKVVGPLKLSKDLLLQKQADVVNALENARIELEIYSRMSSEKDESLRVNLKIKDWTTKIKEAELRLSIIANLLAGR